MTKKEMVLNSSPEAASIQTVTGWVSRGGRFWGDDERMARYDGCTHVACEKCGAAVEKGWLACRKCRDQADVDRYNAMPRKPWDGNSMVYSQTKDCYYPTPSDAEDDREDGQAMDDLQLVLCEPNYGSKLQPDHFCNDLPDDAEDDLPDVLHDAIDAFNAAVDAAGPLSWSPGKFALAPEGTPSNAELRGASQLAGAASRSNAELGDGDR